MRVLILNWRDPDHPRAGGSEVYASRMAANWAAAGHEVTLFCGTAKAEPYEVAVDNYRMVGHGGRLTVYHRARKYFVQRAGSFDIVLDIVNTRPFFACDWGTDTTAVALIYQLADDVWSYEMPQPLAALGRHVLEPRWLRHYSDHPVLTISASSRESLLARGLRDVRIVPVGADDAHCEGTRRADIPTLIFVGRLSANKRPDHALQAYELLRRRLPRSQMWVVGDGPLLHRLVARRPEGVTFFGRVDQDTKHQLMAQAHALVATSVREGWGMIVSEAGRLGTRSVAYDVPGLRDSVTASGGLLVEPQPAALASLLAELLPVWASEPRPHLGACGTVPWSAASDAVMAQLLAAHAARPHGISSHERP